jgi:hypothetical protein
MIAIVEKLDLPTVEGEYYWELRDTNSHCGDAVKELIQMLQYVDLLTVNSDELNGSLQFIYVQNSDIHLQKTRCIVELK